MQSILEAFANDSVAANPHYFQKDSEYSRAVKRIVHAEEKLLEALNADEKKLYEEFSQAQSDLNFLSGTDRFIYGYRLGVLMTMDVFSGRDDLIVGGIAE